MKKTKTIKKEINLRELTNMIIARQRALEEEIWQCQELLKWIDKRVEETI